MLLCGGCQRPQARQPRIVGQQKKLFTLSFDWFVLALSFLYAIFAVEMSDGLIATSRRSE